MPRREDILRFEEMPPPPGSSPWVVPPVRATVEVVDHDPSWPAQAQQVARLVQDVLGPRALRVEHVGSTAVPGLAAKPILDLDLTVADPDNEPTWIPPLQSAGFVLTVREPWWYGHRMLRGGRRPDDGAPGPGAPSRIPDGPAINLHVFGPDSPELVRHVVLRNWLRTSAEDRDLYAATKRAAAAAGGSTATVMEYNARKENVIREIYARAFSAAGFTD